MKKAALLWFNTALSTFGIGSTSAGFFEFGHADRDLGINGFHTLAPN